MAILSALLVGCDGRETEADSPPSALVADSTADPAVLLNRDHFGFDSTRFAFREAVIKRNQTFSDLLSEAGVPYPSIARLVDYSTNVFDLRDMRASHKYRLYFRSDSASQPSYMVYQHNSVDYVVFQLEDSLLVRKESRPVTVNRRHASGSISSSLYQTLVDKALDPSLAIELSEVFAWQIDFFRIQKGDSFDVIYEERLVGDKPIGVGRVYAARFVHSGADYLGFYFPEEGDVAYFDEKGESLRKAFLQAPVKYSRISSRYSLKRFHPVLKRNRSHLGTDYAAAYGTPIRATGDGVVMEAQRKQYNGRYVKIRHNGTYTTAYLHMQKIADGIKPGVRVRQGDVIGFVGSTGLATGPHVCYRFWKNGSQVDPMKEAFPSAKPVSDENVALFAELRDAYLRELMVASRQPTTDQLHASASDSTHASLAAAP
ncbi:MAG: peptidoglycan DD-metalloendopeptidase family protein [Bacteroidetes bacterium]|nr:peptidoglycan DD-metalloendopeptidase family protein [Bacteroidota bacterium]